MILLPIYNQNKNIYLDNSLLINELYTGPMGSSGTSGTNCIGTSGVNGTSYWTLGSLGSPGSSVYGSYGSLASNYPNGTSGTSGTSGVGCTSGTSGTSGAIGTPTGIDTHPNNWSGIIYFNNEQNNTYTHTFTVVGDLFDSSVNVTWYASVVSGPGVISGQYKPAWNTLWLETYNSLHSTTFKLEVSGYKNGYYSDPMYIYFTVYIP